MSFHFESAEKLYEQWSSHSRKMGGKPKSWSDLPEVQQRAWKQLLKDLNDDHKDKLEQSTIR